MRCNHSLVKMFVKCTAICACFALISLSVAFKAPPYVINGNPLFVNQNPFVKIGCGYYYIEPNNEKNWYGAYESCHQMNATLVSFDSAQELKLVTEYLKNNKLYRNYWTSGMDLVWFSNGQPVSSDLWYPGEPNNLHETEHCIEMGKTDGLELAGLNDIACSERKRIICQAP